jgi:hypothetical protein
MSWDADLTDADGNTVGEWNHTHNCNGMIEAVLGDAIDDTRVSWWSKPGSGMGRGSWWDLLDGRSGPDGADLLGRIIKRLEADPDRFAAMNPENKWGSYDSLLIVLRGMRDAVPEWPTTWRVTG